MDFPCSRDEFLLDVLVQHGLEAELHDGWIFPDTHEVIPIRATAYATNAASTVVLFEIEAVLPDGRVLIETIAGVGTDGETALAQAEVKFLAGPFHALIEGLYGVAIPDQVEHETWRVGATSYAAYLGACQLVGARFDVPKELVATLQERIAERVDESAGLHWCRVYWGGGASRITEVLWDNQPWDAVEREVAAMAWPQLEGYVSARLFLVLRGPSQWDPRVTEVMDLAVRYNLEIADEHAYYEMLERSMTAREAQLAVHFMQVAFGRALIVRLFPSAAARFHDEFHWHDAGKILGLDRLSDQPYFRAGVRAAQLANFATLEAIGAQSAEFRALNASMQVVSERGEAPDDAWFAGLEFAPLSIPRPPTDG